MFDDLQELKRKVEGLQREHDRAAGARDQLMKRLKAEFGCSTLEEAEALLERLQVEEREAARKYTARKKKFEKEFGPVLRSKGEM